MVRWARHLGRIGEVVRLDYPYAKAGRRSPDGLPVLVEAHRDALRAARGHRSRRKVILAGKSMGGRVGCHLALEEPVDGLVCLGYPLVGQRGKVRDEVLVALRTPILFLQGTRDPLCPLDRLSAVRARMEAPSALHVVEGGNHSLEVGVRALRAAGTSPAEVEAAALAAIASFAATHLGLRSALAESDAAR